MFGYQDEILTEVKDQYPPYGGDPSTPSLILFNDPNVTKEEVTMELQVFTGKDDYKNVGQYYKINELTYLTNNYSHFNGNQTYWQLQSPWEGLDYFYGTNGKIFAPNQEESNNISIYVPNLQRYGSASH